MSDASIRRVRGCRVWDSRGRPTVEVEISLAGGAQGRAIAPAGASTGSGEALDLRDGGEAFGGYGVQRAIANVNGVIAESLDGLDAREQAKIDNVLVDLDGTAGKTRLGGNASIAVSLAVAQAAAASRGQPLWRYLSEGAEVLLPLPEIQIFGGGAHAGSRVDIQDFMVVPLGASSFDEALAWTAEVYRAAGEILAESGRLRGVADEGGFWPEFASNEEALETLVRAIERSTRSAGDEIGIALDVAATQFYRDGGYHFRLDRRVMDAEGLIERLCAWVGRFPIVSIEDPLAEHDLGGFARFTAAVGRDIQVVGDDLLVTSAERIRAAAQRGACNTALIKPNQIGTLSETRAALDAAREVGWGAIASARSGETEDVAIVHLAVGLGVKQLKVGSFARSERMAKWNEALRIEAALGERAVFAGRSALETSVDQSMSSSATPRHGGAGDLP